MWLSTALLTPMDAVVRKPLLNGIKILSNDTMREPA